MPVLVLDGHSRAALETLQSLGRAGIEVDIAAESLDCLAMYSRYATNQLLQPSQANGAFQAWLRDQDRVRGYELIVPATEASLRGLRVLDEEDPLRRKAVLPSNYALDIAIDKEKTCALAAHLGIPVPQGRLISSIHEIGGRRNFSRRTETGLQQGDDAGRTAHASRGRGQDGGTAPPAIAAMAAVYLRAGTAVRDG